MEKKKLNKEAITLYKFYHSISLSVFYLLSAATYKVGLILSRLPPSLLSYVIQPEG